METANASPLAVGRIIEWDGDTWKIVGLGTRIDGKVNTHLASTTRGRQQRNGFYPIQMVDWLPENL